METQLPHQALQPDRSMFLLTLLTLLSTSTTSSHTVWLAHCGPGCRVWSTPSGGFLTCRVSLFSKCPNLSRVLCPLAPLSPSWSLALLKLGSFLLAVSYYWMSTCHLVAKMKMLYLLCIFLFFSTLSGIMRLILLDIILNHRDVNGHGKRHTSILSQMNRTKQWILEFFICFFNGQK